MTRVFITNCQLAHNLSCMHNKGSAAHIASTISMIRDAIPDAVFSTNIQMPTYFAEQCNIRVMPNATFYSKSFSIGTMLKSSSNLTRCILWAACHRRFPRLARLLVGNRELREYSSADVIVDVSMDVLSDDFGLVTVVEHSKDILLGVLLGRPVVVWAQSPGPFRSRLTRWLVRMALNRVALITVREEVSAAYLREISISRPPIYVTADPAFILEPSGEQTALDILVRCGVDPARRPLVGLAPSWTLLMTRAKKSGYLRYLLSVFRVTRLIMPEKLSLALQRRAGRLKSLDMSSLVGIAALTEVVDHLVEKLGASVILIPHDTDPLLDDRHVCSEIIRRTKHPTMVKLVDGDCSASDLKAVIGRCDLFVGGKMHANIAALSMRVPTLGIAYHHKFSGIMGLLGQEKRVCTDLNPDELKQGIDSLWLQREGTRVRLTERIGALETLARENARLLASLVQLNASGEAWSQQR